MDSWHRVQTTIQSGSGTSTRASARKCWRDWYHMVIGTVRPWTESIELTGPYDQDLESHLRRMWKSDRLHFQCDITCLVVKWSVSSRLWHWCQYHTVMELIEMWTNTFDLDTNVIRCYRILSNEQISLDWDFALCTDIFIRHLRKDVIYCWIISLSQCGIPQPRLMY